MELRRRFVFALATLVSFWTSVPSAEPVVVRHVEGLVHGFLSLRSPEGAVIANGDLIQDARGGRVISRRGCSTAAEFLIAVNRKISGRSGQASYTNYRTKMTNPIWHQQRGVILVISSDEHFHDE